MTHLHVYSVLPGPGGSLPAVRTWSRSSPVWSSLCPWLHTWLRTGFLLRVSSSHQTQICPCELSGQAGELAGLRVLGAPPFHALLLPQLTVAMETNTTRRATELGLSVIMEGGRGGLLTMQLEDEGAGAGGQSVPSKVSARHLLTLHPHHPYPCSFGLSCGSRGLTG